MDETTGQRPTRAPAPTVPRDHPAAGPAAAEFARGDLMYKRYLVVHWIPGGSSDVYLCAEAGTWAMVAVKIPRAQAEDKSGHGQLRAFRDEVQHWADLAEHPNVVRCYGARVQERRWFLVLEWVGAPEVGQDLELYLGAAKGMSRADRMRQTLRLGRDICDGLAHIHASGIIHGDLKPANILLDKANRAKITDLDAGSKRERKRTGRLSATREDPAGRPRAAGTAGYVAPELRDGHPASVQSDIYALGCVLYELATGKTEFPAADPDEAAQWARPDRTRQLPDDPELPGPLRRLISDCLRKNPARRPGSAAKVGRRLAAALPGARGDAHPELAGRHGDDGDEDPYDRGMPGMRSRRRMSLLSAAGRAPEAVEQVSAAIREEIGHFMTSAAKYLSGEPPAALAISFNNRGILLGQTDGWVASVSDFLTAIRLDPRFASAYANLGTTYQRLNLPELAIVAFTLAIDQDPGDHQLYLKRAAFLAQHGWHESAREDCEHAASLAPADPDICYAMANTLTALGRADEAIRYRSRAGGHAPDGTIEYLRPRKMSSEGDALTEMVSAHFSYEKGDHEAAITSYSAAIDACPWKTGILCDRGEARLAAGDPLGAISDLRAFLAQASTTHPRAKAARRILHQAREEAGNSDADEVSYPQAKPASYISREPCRRLITAALVTQMPLTAGQRFILLDMLHSSDPDRKLHATRLLWKAFHEDHEERTSSYGEMLRDLTGHGASKEASDFVRCQTTAEQAIRNGFGAPVLLAEVQVSPDELRDVRFDDSGHSALAWASAGAAGLWEVVPGTQTDHLPVEEPPQAPLFVEDGSACVVLGKHDLRLRRAGEHGEEVLAVEGGSALAGCPYGHSGLAVGLSTGLVVITDDPAAAHGAKHVQLTRGKVDSLRLWRTGTGDLAAFADGLLYSLMSSPGQPVPVVRTLGKPRVPDDSRFMAGRGSHVLWAVSDDELLLTRLGQAGPGLRLPAPNSTDGGFTAADVSCDGSLVAAICGSFLHVWQAGGSAGSEYLPMTSQPWGQCIAVSADSRYIAIGTTAGSILIYMTKLPEEQ